MSTPLYSSPPFFSSPFAIELPHDQHLTPSPTLGDPAYVSQQDPPPAATPTCDISCATKSLSSAMTLKLPLPPYLCSSGCASAYSPTAASSASSSSAARIFLGSSNTVWEVQVWKKDGKGHAYCVGRQVRASVLEGLRCTVGAASVSGDCKPIVKCRIGCGFKGQSRDQVGGTVLALSRVGCGRGNAPRVLYG